MKNSTQTVGDFESSDENTQRGSEFCVFVLERWTGSAGMSGGVGGEGGEGMCVLWVWLCVFNSIANVEFIVFRSSLYDCVCYSVSSIIISTCVCMDVFFLLNFFNNPLCDRMSITPLMSL